METKILLDILAELQSINAKLQVVLEKDQKEYIIEDVELCDWF